MPFTTPQIAEASGIGLVAGVLGGLAGIGGSMIMLPGLHVVFGEPTPAAHHLYMGAAMAVNVAVSLPAAVQHHRLGAVRTDLLRPLLASTVVGMVAGVLTGNLFPGESLRLLLALFLLAYCVYNTARLIRPVVETGEAGCPSSPRLVFSGASTGLVGGLLGLGGGVLLVPMLQLLCRVPLRQSIATSSTVICITATLGATLKIATLPALGESPRGALMLALLMAPAAVVGGLLGARLTHRLPLRAVRLVVTVLLAVVALRLAGALG